MDTPMDKKRMVSILSNDNAQRYKYLLKEVVNLGEIWILTDEHGCVMLSTDDAFI